MRILMLAWEYAPHIIGGMGKHVSEIVPALDADGIEVHVLAPLLRGGAAEEQLGQHSRVSRVLPPVMPDYGFITFAKETNRYLEARAHELAQTYGPFDIIHGHDWLTSYASVALKYLWQVPLVSTIHATERGRGRGRTEGHHAESINGIEWWLTYESWRVIVCSGFMADQLYHYFNTPLDKTHVVPNAVHIPEIDWTDAERIAFREYYAHADQQIVFTIARLVHEKGVHVLVEAIPQVVSQRPDVKFVIAGAGHQLEQLQARVAEFGLQDRVFFTGFIPDMVRDKLYNVANMAVFPSLYEPFGIVALEAMAARCPVVVSDTGGLSEVVRLYENGLTTYPDNPDSLTWAILHALNQPEEAQKRVEQAFADVQQIYNWATIAHQTKMIYEQILRERHVSNWTTT